MDDSAAAQEQEAIDARVVAEANDESAWEEAIDVRRNGAAIMLPPTLARRAAFLSQVHRETTPAWIERIVRERIELEERALADARRALATKRSA
jgi:hypothetical protein